MTRALSSGPASGLATTRRGRVSIRLVFGATLWLSFWALGHFWAFGHLVAFAKSNRSRESKAPPVTPANPAAEMAQVIAKYGNPGPKHQFFKSLAGSYTTHTKAWMGPGKPVESDGTAELKLILGGRFLEENLSGTFLGNPFSGHGVSGYDLGKQKYVSFWVDNLGTWFTLTDGSLDKSGKVLTMTGESWNPVLGKMTPCKFVTRVESEDRHVFEAIDKIEGKEVTIMEVVYTRKK